MKRLIFVSLMWATSVPSSLGSPEYSIVMVRHGQSEANPHKITCGWYDVNLTKQGIEDAHRAGRALREARFQFDLIHTSLLKRAHQTVNIIIEELLQEKIGVVKDWHFNERHYGDLTGRRRDDLIDEFGKDKVQVWRRSYYTAPPPMKRNHRLFHAIRFDERYKDIPEKEFPKGESLCMVIKRVLPYWENVVVPQIRRGIKILIVGHTTILRALVTYLEDLSETAVMTLDIPNGVPFVYTLDENMKPTGPMKFIGDEASVKAAEEMALAGRDVNTAAYKAAAEYVELERKMNTAKRFSEEDASDERRLPSCPGPSSEEGESSIDGEIENATMETNGFRVKAA